MFSLLVAAVAAERAEADAVFRLTVLHNNDGESALLPKRVDDAGVAREYGGAALFMALVKRLKAQAVEGGDDGLKRGLIMLSSGDNFLAGPVFNASLEKGVPYYDALAMSEIGYDAICIGNHDFDFGPAGLADFIVGFPADTPFLSANLDVSAEPRLAVLAKAGRIAASTVIESGGEKIGVVGATTEELPFISSPRKVKVGDALAAVQREIDVLQARGIDKIILISHLQSISDDLAFLPRLNGVDIAIAGGGDELLANAGTALIPGDGENVFGPYPMLATDVAGRDVPVITTSGSYRYVGKLVVDFDAAGEIVTIDRAVSGPVRVAGANNPDAVKPDAKVQEQVGEPVAAAVSSLAATVVGISEVALDGRRIQVRSRETNQGNLIADALLWQGRQLAAAFDAPAPDVALQNGGGIRNDTIVTAGTISELDTFTMVPFPNFISIVAAVPRAQFREILENAVSQVEDGAGRFAQIAGFTMVWDPAGAAQMLDESGRVIAPGARVRQVTLTDGSEIVKAGAVVDGADLSIATVDFLARGGDQYPFQGAQFINLGVTYQQALRDYIVGALGGKIAEDRYPEGGEGRITHVQ